MRKLNSKFENKKMLDKKSNILSDEDMAKRSEEKGKIAKIFPKDMERVKRMALSRDVTIDNMMKLIYETYKKDLAEGIYDPPVIPIQLPLGRSEKKKKSVRIPVEFQEDMAQYRIKTGTGTGYQLSDFIEYYYYEHFNGGRQNPVNMRPYKKMESRVDEIIEDRIRRKKERW